MKKVMFVPCASVLLASTFLLGSVELPAQTAAASYYVSDVKTDKKETKSSVTFKQGQVTISATKETMTNTPGTSTRIHSVRISEGSSSFDVKLNDTVSNIQSIAVSSDTSYVAIQLEKEAGSELLVVDLHQKTHTVINTIVNNAASVENVWAYQWSPVDSTLAVAYGNTSLSRVALYRASTATFTYVPRETNTISSAAVLWNKQGTTVDFVSEYPSDHYKLYRYTLQTKKVQILKSLTRSEVTQLATMPAYTVAASTGLKVTSSIPYTAAPAQSDGQSHDGRILTATDAGTMLFYNQAGAVAFTLANNLVPVADFHDQRALVKDTATQLYGYINTQGKLVIPCDYVQASSFSEGLAFVKKSKDDHGAFITSSGKQVTTLERTYDSDFQFSDGLAVAYSANSGKAGYLNKGGDIVIPYAYDYARTFSEQAAVVQDDKGNYGFINPQGKVIIPLQYQAAGDFSEGLAPVQNSAGLWGYMNKKGKVVIPFQYAHAASFSEGLAAVYNKQGKVGYINQQGTIAIVYTPYNRASSFNEGVAVVGIETKTSHTFGYIDTRGTLLTPLQYQQAYPFHEGVAVASLSDQAAVILNRDRATTSEAVVIQTLEKARQATTALQAVRLGTELPTIGIQTMIQYFPVGQSDVYFDCTDDRIIYYKVENHKRHELWTANYKMDVPAKNAGLPFFPYKITKEIGERPTITTPMAYYVFRGAISDLRYGLIDMNGNETEISQTDPSQTKVGFPVSQAELALVK